MSIANASSTTNPSVQVGARGFTLRHLTMIFVALALMVTGYLSYTKFTATPMACIQGSIFNCAAVEASPWAEVQGIPVAFLGFIAHVTLMTLLVTETRVPLVREYGVMAIFGLSLFGFMYHSYLTYTSVTVIQALCMWCLTAHTLMTLVLIVTSIRLYRSFTSAPAA